MSLSADKNTLRRADDLVTIPMAADAVIYKGALVCTNATGYAVPGSEATTLTAAGRAEEAKDNTGGADGAVSIEVRRGAFKFENDGDDLVTQAELLKTCYIADDETVSKTDNDSARSAAGKVLEVASDGVWVEIK